MHLQLQNLSKNSIYESCIATIKHQQQSLIPLGEVSYIDHMMSFGTVKDQSFRDNIKP